jgi:hypothetical protein
MNSSLRNDEFRLILPPTFRSEIFSLHYSKKEKTNKRFSPVKNFFFFKTRGAL